MADESTGRPALLYGAAAIGAYLGMTEREVRHQIEANGLPVIRMGQRRLAARPARLDAWLDALEDAANGAEKASGRDA